MPRKHVDKIGLAAIQAGRVLLVRKKGTRLFILPGGKPERGESDLQALARELDEELGCSTESPRFEGAFTDVAAEMSETVVTVRLYSAHLIGEPHPASEIEEISWLDLFGQSDLPVAPSLANQILPHLRGTLVAA